jgi:hypothetical protein
MMTYDTFLLSCLMVDMGINVNGVPYGSLPYDVQFDNVRNDIQDLCL